MPGMKSSPGVRCAEFTIIREPTEPTSPSFMGSRQDYYPLPLAFLALRDRDLAPIIRCDSFLVRFGRVGLVSRSTFLYKAPRLLFLAVSALSSLHQGIFKPRSSSPLFDCHSLSIEISSCTVHSLNMQTTFALAALASVAFALPQGGPSNKSPDTPSPAGCQKTYNGEFQITIVNGSSTAVTKRQTTCGQANLLTAKLADGVLTDSQGRIGSIVANYQFQFDGPPPQAGALYTAGFSVCQNGTLAIGGSAVFYACQSGEFSNLYDRAWANQCKPVFLNVLPCGSSGGAGQKPDGQPTFTSAAPPVSQIGDGQPQGTTAVNPPVTQIGDGQVQVPTKAPHPVTQISDGQIQVPNGVPITQIGDGQVQAPTGVTQISDGQVQVPTSAPAPPVTQISDGQVQVPTVAPTPVTQISDGQVQVPTVAPTPVTQIPDGQVQVPTTAAGPTVSQIPDGQVQTNTTIPVIVGPNAGNGLKVAGSLAAIMAGLAAVLLL
ncbi:hypothetical protein ONS95_004129 [Cadophora gregata]|uniref:uncharacterized protein n=1 Tax=Cadophora gregata TaxID=51156 RepID=UPI0026DD571B|nr:uncharacterized protein ONS95_004129 [Cadophora gregata]KAK0105510.1 hypothetical protein ONS96_004896 [Cadophora gregata f. sp. sojae]KAK0105597.1 hypothetical protein ONS95_004129 [Cadophora gregata]